ncbi:hypothetical protein [Anseongella ginsenosidimutans]|uniref:hypothetical protein n=1 Tax=Anseongella ginsenosidimutans TaxID=496056 RepID=UPI001CEF881D|nr:hypothetical protein [Anseongella ginsenosidimutans]
MGHSMRTGITNDELIFQLQLFNEALISFPGLEKLEINPVLYNAYLASVYAALKEI